MRSVLNNSYPVVNRGNSNSSKRWLGLIVFGCALICPAVFPSPTCGQAQFREPQIPGSRTIGGQLVSGPVTRQDGLKAISQQPISETPELQFPSQSGFEVGSGWIQDQSIVAQPSPGEFRSVERFRPAERFQSVEQFESAEPFQSSYLQPQSGLGEQIPFDQGGIELLPSSVDDIENQPTPDGLEVITQRYPDGKPKIIRHVAQDEEGNYYNEGPWEVRNQSGQVIAAGTYRRGRMHGQWRRQHAAGAEGLFSKKPFNLFQGPFLSVAQFKDGKLDGVWTIYDRYRQKIFEIPYEKGVRHGTAHWFYPNSSKMREASFKRGLIDGEILDWNEGEKLVKREAYSDGRRIVRNTTFYRPNVKKTEDYFLGSKLEPEDEDNWWEAKPTPFLPIGSEVQHGPSMAWYENSQPKKQGHYKDGEPIGRFIWWHANGNKEIEGFYRDGQKTRRWTWWYENGMKRIEGVYENDQPAGVWKSWYPDGQLRKQQDFSTIEEEIFVNSRQSDSDDSANSVDLDESEFTIEFEPTIEILPDPGVESPSIRDLQRDEMEDIAPLEFRDSGTSDTGSLPDELFVP